MTVSDRIKLKITMMVICIGCYAIDIVPTIAILYALYNTSAYDEFRSLILSVLLIFMLVLTFPLSDLSKRAWRGFKSL